MSKHAPILAFALLLAILLWLCSSCEKPRLISQEGFYIDSAKCKKLIVRSGQIVVGYKELSGCLFHVSALVKERDSLQAELENCR